MSKARTQTAKNDKPDMVLVRLKGGATFSPARDELFTAADGPFPVPRTVFDAFGDPLTGVMERILKEEQYVEPEEVEVGTEVE